MVARQERVIRGFNNIAFGLCLLVFALGGYGAWRIAGSTQARTPAATVTQSPVVQTPRPVSARSNTLFFGNAYFSRYINDWSMASDLKYAYPFSRLNEFGRDQYDAWIAGLECPLVSGFQQTSAQEDAMLSFNCNPEYMTEAKKWFTAFTLANNHTDNRGPEGFAETKKHLDEQGIQYFGHYDPRELNDVCDVISLPTGVTYDDGTTEKGALPVALCGYHGFIRIPPPESIAVISQYAPYMPVIAMPHMGKEYVPAADELKTATYRAMIDAGADMVIGDHPHWVQNSEAYKGHPIIYSMGNFLFDQQYNTEVTRSAAVNVLIEVKDADKTLLKKWLSLGSQCKAYHDTCLEQIKQSRLAKLPYTFTLNIVGTDDSGHIVKPASPAVQAGILERLNWSKTVSGLTAPYEGR